MDKFINRVERITVPVVIGIIANPKGELLVAQRPDHWLGGGFWEFPGGKVEPGEDAKTALERELLEELGITVNQCSPFMDYNFDYPERTINLHAWRVHAYTGIASGVEGQCIAWCYPSSLADLNMLPANRAIVIALQSSPFLP